MGFVVSVLVDRLEMLDPSLPGLAVHGANLTVSAFLRALAADDAVDTLEVILPPQQTLRADVMALVAEAILPQDRKGRGVLHFVPLHSLPELWADGRERILWTQDPEAMARNRYLRDTLATAPMTVVSMTHALGHHRLWPALARLADAPPVAFDSIACISRSLREALRKAFEGFLSPAGSPPPARLDLLPHSVDTVFFQPATPEARRQSRRLLHMRVPEEARVCLFLGRLTPSDKADLAPLLDAFARATQDPNDVLLLAGQEGTPGYAEWLEQAGRAAGLGERLLIRTDVPPDLRPLFYAAADVFVFPADSLQEGLGTTVLEAMASGLPVIASDWDGMPDMVRDGENGILVPTSLMPLPARLEALSPANRLLTEYLLTAQSVVVDVDALADALGRLLGSQPERRRMGDTGRRMAVETFSPKRGRERWHALFTELMDLARREPPDHAALRRAGALALALPTPHNRLFHHYASHVVAPEHALVTLTERGRAILAGTEELRFYDETLPLLYPDVMSALFDGFHNAGDAALRLSELSGAVARATGRRNDDVLYHAALLWKRGVIKMTSGG